MRLLLKAVIRLYLLQISAFLAIWFSTYYPGLDILLAFVYLIIIRIEAGLVKGYPRRKILRLALIWQGPAAFLGLLVMGDFYVKALGENAIFLLEFWSTPLLPLLTPLTGFNYFNHPLYYYMLPAMPWLTGIYYYAMSILQSNTNTSKNS